MRFTKSMAEEVKGVEEKTEQAPASQSGVEAKPSVAPADDPEAKVNALLEENARLRRDGENYRKGLLALKGKTELEELDMSDPVQVHAFIQKSIKDELAQDKVSANENELAVTVKEQARKLKELQFALANKAPVTNAAAGGGGQDTVAAPSGAYFSADQRSQLEARWKSIGIKADKFPEMLKQAEDNAKRSTTQVL
jgi:hypothetical protein